MDEQLIVHLIDRILVGDKVILPHAILGRVIHSTSFPYIFKITTIHSKSKYVGVLEFSAPDNTIHIPNWMMDILDVHPNDIINLSFVENVKKAEFIQFQPRELGIASIPKETLQHLLEKFTVLSEHESIQVFTPEGKVLTLNVTLCTPSPACLIDAEFKVDFLPAIEQEVEYQKTLVINNVNRTNPGGYEFYCASPTYWTFSGCKTTITINHSENVYCEHADIKLLRVLPAGTTYVQIEAQKEAQKESNQVDIHISDEQKPVIIACGNCENCHAFIPDSAMNLHATRCHRINWYCEKCSKVYAKHLMHSHCAICNDPTFDIETHQKVCHTELECVCKKMIDRSYFRRHKSNDCEYRLVKCKWCVSDIPAKDVMNHQLQCGNTTFVCDLCKRNIHKSRMRIHMLVSHPKK
jgi:hypothetical protein